MARFFVFKRIVLPCRVGVTRHIQHPTPTSNSVLGPAAGGQPKRQAKERGCKLNYDVAALHCSSAGSGSQSLLPRTHCTNAARNSGFQMPSVGPL